MPAYNYQCDSCNEGFRVKMTMAEKSQKSELPCPACGSVDTRQVFESINVIGSTAQSYQPSPRVTGGGGCASGQCGLRY